MQEIYLTMKEAARRLGVSPQALRNWYKNGRIKMLRLPSGRLRMPESELQRIIDTANEPVSQVVE